MEIILNGEPKKIAEGINISELVSELGLVSERVAVELNYQIIKREQWAQCALKQGDRIEVVQFVGGGTSNSRRDKD